MSKGVAWREWRGVAWRGAAWCDVAWCRKKRAPAQPAVIKTDPIPPTPPTPPEWMAATIAIRK